MHESDESALHRLLRSLRASGSEAREAEGMLYRTLYADLRVVAAGIMRAERVDHTLQPTELVHEAFLRLTDGRAVEWQDRSHFLGVATRVMRQVLVDHARRRNAAKRGGGWDRVSLDDSISDSPPSVLPVLDLDRALQRLADLDARMSRVAELRIIGGLTRREIGEVLSVSERTVAEDWSVARRWLARELGDGPAA